MMSKLGCAWPGWVWVLGVSFLGAQEPDVGVTPPPSSPAAQVQGAPEPAAGVPRLVKFSGVLKDATGKALPGPVEVTFSLYKEQGSTEPLWWETQLVDADGMGRYTVLLGAMHTGGLPAEPFTSGEAHWLGARVGLEPEQPRVLLVSVPYALKAGDAETLGGKPASDFVQTESTNGSLTTPQGGLGTSGARGAGTRKGGKSRGSNPSPLAAVGAAANFIPIYLDNSGTLGTSTLFQNGLDRVGIGTTAPTSSLTVSGSPNQFALVNPILGGETSVAFLPGGTVNGWQVGVNGGVPGYFVLENGGGYRFVVRQGGNVGIGTASPTFRLTVDGLANQLALRDTSPGAEASVHYLPGGTLHGWQVGANSFASGYFFFEDGAGYRLVIKQGGNVGVGTANPPFPLTVDGTPNQLALRDTTPGVEASINYQPGGTLHGWQAGVNSAGPGYFISETGGGIRLLVQEGGNVGVGTTNPAQKLHVVGNIKASGAINASAAVTGTQFVSTVASGTPPLLVNSTTQVSNLNASLLGGFSASAFATRGMNTFSGDQTIIGSLTLGGSINDRLTVQATPLSANIIGGWSDNSISVGVVGATISGGGQEGAESLVTDNFGAIGGGQANTVGNADGDLTNAAFATVAGGTNNSAQGLATTVGGGQGNTAQGTHSTFGGGSNNNAGAANATIAGGLSNTATGLHATVGGGNNNTAASTDATVPGGVGNVAGGIGSLAAGNRAKALHNGAFVWGDGKAFDVASTVTNQFVARATGGVFFISGIDAVTGAASGGVTLPPGAGAWSSLSDRNSKENFAAVDGPMLLARLAKVPIRTWSYRAQAPSVRHIGPTAQDFRAAFGLGEDEKHITTIDADGVALAAIQELYRMSLAKDRELAELRNENHKLQAEIRRLNKGGGQMSSIEARLERLEAQAREAKATRRRAVCTAAAARARRSDGEISGRLSSGAPSRSIAPRRTPMGFGL